MKSIIIIFLSLFCFVGLAMDLPNIESKVPESYSINLLWTNKTVNAAYKYISTAGTQHEFVDKLITPVFKWARANHSADVFLWFDSAHTTPEQIQNSQKLLESQKKLQNIKNVKMRDVREIPIVEANYDVFSDFVSLYYRIDILKLIILVYSIECEKYDSAIFTDLEVGDERANKDRMNKEELFEASVMKDLNHFGLVHNASTGSDIDENQFLQLINNKRMIAAIKIAIVNANLLRAETALNYRGDQERRKNLIRNLEQPLHSDTCRRVYSYFEGLTIGFKDHPIMRDEHYDSKKDKYLLLANFYNSRIHKPYIGKAPGFSDHIKIINDLPAGGQIGINWDNYDGPWPSREVDVRWGNHHTTQWHELFIRKPSDGSDTYRVQYYQ